jgi:tetratricopeptide (TPR) repeat protein
MMVMAAVGAVALGTDRLAEAIDHYNQSIQVAETILAGAKDDYSKRQASRVLSDRLGNLAVCLIRVNELPKAFQLLEQAMQIDTQNGNVAGWIQKQGSLGQWYLAQGNVPARSNHAWLQTSEGSIAAVTGEDSSAKRVFEEALEFIRTPMPQAFGSSWNYDHLVSVRVPLISLVTGLIVSTVQGPAEQVALYNLADYYVKHQDFATARSMVETAIIKHPAMNRRFVVKSLRMLQNIFVELNEKNLAADVDAAMIERGLKDPTQKATSVQKRVILSLDYSGSMAGGKIRSALVNLETILRDHINDDDQVALLYFNAVVMLAIPLQTKNKGNIDSIIGEVRRLCNPVGATAFLDSVDQALGMLTAARNQPGAFSEWIVALTGEGWW